MHRARSFLPPGGDRTLIKLEARVLNETDGADQYLRGMCAGWYQSLDRLEDELAPDTTLLIARMVFGSADERDFVAREFGAVEGMTQTINRLAAQLGSSPSSSLNAVGG